jgi:hypothetical protein
MTTTPPPFRILASSDAAPVVFAASELADYLARLSGATPEAASVRIAPDSNGTSKELRVGTFEDFGEGFREWPEVRDAELDDAIFIEAEGLAGIVAGNNPRSVLLAAYRYLTELGCRWVRPGLDGEHIPRPSPGELESSAVRVAEVASYRHRGICIEGAVSYEHVRDLIDWAPKVGLNTYFMQFREAYTFFERWYAHRENPLLPEEPFSVEQARELKAQLVEEMAERGLVFHDVGHGWTCEPFGMPGLGWEYDAPEVPEHTKQYLAEVNGERELWGGVPLNTNLCYSNPEVRGIIVDDIARYAREHPEVDAIHFWLADGSNNHCECERCREATPSDWYVKMLNELDERLSEEDLSTRIVFLIYVDLLWPPETERIRNPDRFVLMFAPITRTYTEPFSAEPGEAPLPPYERNRLTFPREVDQNVAFLRAWQKLFAGDSFDFDYHYMWDHYKDPGYVSIAKVLHEDIRGLKDLGLDGLVSCQVQRAFFPTGLGMAVLGRTLWDRDLSFEEVSSDYFHAAFGEDGEVCLEYCRNLSDLFDATHLRNGDSDHGPSGAETYEEVSETIESFRPTIQRNLTSPDPCHAASWRYLDAHADVCLHLAGALRQRTSGDEEGAGRAWEQTKRIVQEREMELHPALDVYEFTRTVGGLFEARR